jgi:hypothetical protein
MHFHRRRKARAGLPCPAGQRRGSASTSRARPSPCRRPSRQARTVAHVIVRRPRQAVALLAAHAERKDPATLEAVAAVFQRGYFVEMPEHPQTIGGKVSGRAIARQCDHAATITSPKRGRAELKGMAAHRG